MKRAARTFLVLSYLGILIGLGIRSLVLDDARFGWGMFSSQANYRVEYYWIDEEGHRTPHRTGEELRRGEPEQVASRVPHLTRYGIGAVRGWVQSYLRFLYDQKRPEGMRQICAEMEYRINLSGANQTLTLTYPDPDSETGAD